MGGLPRPRIKRPAALVAELGGRVGEYGVAGFEETTPGPADIMVEEAMLRPPHF